MYCKYLHIKRQYYAIVIKAHQSVHDYRWNGLVVKALSYGIAVTDDGN